jgi:sortase A
LLTVSKIHPWLYAAVPATAALFSLCLAVSSAWIPLKAELAQWLIERSWRQALAGGPAQPPWPWADTTPVAVLHAPGHGVRLLVLGGNSGRNLAFGPVRVDGTDGGRDVVISGHRDTHFRFLRDLRHGDRLRLTGRGGSRDFVVRELEVVDSRAQEIVIDPAIERLSLVTCYPFDSLLAGGPLRYVVTAYPARPVPH